MHTDRDPAPRLLALAALTLVAAATGCGGTVVFADGGGGSGGDEPPIASGPAPDGPGPVGPAGNGASITVGPEPSGPGGGAAPQRCSLTEVFADPTCDACALDACCAEAEACIADVERCATPEGELDEQSRLGGALIACLQGNCSAECGVEPPTDELCSSGLLVGTDDPASDAAFTACFNASCCDAFAPCTADGDVEACIDCLNGFGDTARCSGADRCALEACGVGLAFVDVCGSGHVVRNLEVGLCMGAECCSEAVACTLNGQDPETCDACVAAGQGPLCDDLLACRAACGG